MAADERSWVSAALLEISWRELLPCGHGFTSPDGTDPRSLLFLSPIDGMSENAFKTVMEIDTLGTYNTIKATIEELKRTKGSVS